MLALIDYGAGNLTSVRKGFAAVGAEIFMPASPDELAAASGIVVPGVGNFAATAALEGAWRTGIARAAAAGTPLLGICLGMQWLFDGSDEAPDVRGLGAIGGTCTRLQPTHLGPFGPLKVPHVGWNVLRMSRSSAIAAGVATGTYVYFTHSYAAPVTAQAVAVTPHATEFPAVVETGNIFGVQFHPEKSGPAGLLMLENFAEIARAR